MRLSGQDVKRGTFSHRHAILFDAITNEDYNRLSNLSDQQAHFLFITRYYLNLVCWDLSMDTPWHHQINW